MELSNLSAEVATSRTGRLRDIEMSLFIFLVSFCFSAVSCNSTAGEVVSIGYYSSLKATDDEDPHTIEGYSVSLYKSGDLVFGSMAVATGSLEPAQGRLYDVEFDHATRKLSFKSRMSSGQETDPSGSREGRPSREQFEFSGRLSAARLTGTMVIKNGYALNKPGERQRISLKRGEHNSPPASVEKWRSSYKYLDNAW